MVNLKNLYLNYMNKVSSSTLWLSLTVIGLLAGLKTMVSEEANSYFKCTTAECSGNKIDRGVFKKLLGEAYRRSRLNVRLIGVGVRFLEKDNSRWSQLELELNERKD